LSFAAYFGTLLLQKALSDQEQFLIGKFVKMAALSVQE
jgi:hypothetical protein